MSQQIFGKNDEYWIAVDLDGTLAKYDRFRGFEHIGEPVAPMVDKLRMLLNLHEEYGTRKVRFAIFTARAHDPSACVYIRKWLRKHDLDFITEITNIKHPKFKEFWDDRARQIEPNTGVMIR